MHSLIPPNPCTYFERLARGSTGNVYQREGIQRVVLRKHGHVRQRMGLPFCLPIADKMLVHQRLW